MPKPPHKPKSHIRLSETVRSELVESISNETQQTDTFQIGQHLSDCDEEIVTASMLDVASKTSGIKYLIPGWIPFGMITMLLGPAGMGKSALALFGLILPLIIGRMSWFNGSFGPSEPQFVVLLDTEGGNAITVHRLNKSGAIAHANRIKVIDADDPLRPFDATNEVDLQKLEQIIVKYRIPLAVVDSLRGSHAGDENNSSITKVLKALSAIAERTGTAIVILHHTRKMSEGEEISADSSRGSNAIVAMVRSQIGLDKPEPKSEWVRVQMLKENLGLKPNPFGFRVTDTGIEFGPAPQRAKKHSQTVDAEEWLRQNMQPGQWYSSAVMVVKAREAGITDKPLQSAREKLGIVKPNIRKTSTGWEWQMPSST